MSGGTHPRAGVSVFILGIVACVGVIGVGFPDSPSSVAASSVPTAPALARCSALTSGTPPTRDAILTRARMHEAMGTPDHCEVIGSLREHLGFDSRHDASDFRMRLPTRWNGGFFFQTGSGDSEHDSGDAALMRGYAVVSKHAGASDRMTPIAKAIIAAYYGKPPERSYFVGCSDGGREAIALSHAFPDYFDGILAVGPRLNGTTASSDLTAFNRRGGKMIVVSNDASIEWWSRVEASEAAIGEAASSFVRLFAVPGMDGCASGQTSDRFDAFAALADWVEKGLIPDRIIATARDTTPLPGQTRPLCAYPQRASYIGIGSFEDANNFACRTPAP